VNYRKRKDMTEWDRGTPLFQQNLAVEVITHHGNSNANTTSTSRVQDFTLRILGGVRTAGERMLRFELSNEYTFVEHLLTSSSTSATSTANPNVYGEQPIPYNSTSRSIDPRFCPMNVMNSSIKPSRFSMTDHVELYELEISEQDFQALRRDQALRIDFLSFADSVISLLNCCNFVDIPNGDLSSSVQDVREGDARFNDTGNSTSSPRKNQQEPLFTLGGNAYNFGAVGSSPCSKTHTFPTSSASHTNVSTMSNSNVNQPSPYVCRLEIWICQDTKNSSKYHCTASSGERTTNAKFSIVESNRFRELTHISLQLRPGSSESVQLYLSARLVQMLHGNNLLMVRACYVYMRDILDN